MLAKDAVHRWAETDDVWNNSLLRLHRALASVKPESVAHFFNLASCQIQRELVDLARHYFGPEGIGAHHSTEKAAAASDHHPRRDKADTTNDPVKLANWTRFHEQVESLPEEERMVFEQRYYNHLTLIEVSKHWNIPYSKVKSLWGSACERLREAMGDDYPGA
jgi:RNA polymerase sigma-70 factor (ECF subfamily)